MKILDIDKEWFNESEHDNFKFKKIGIDKFKTTIEVRGTKYPVEVYKNGNKWIASYFNGALIKAADTKRFAVLEIRKAMTRDRKFFESLQYNNWSMHNDDTMKSDFNEYKHKEERKWLKRSERMGFKFPIFDSYDEYVNALKSAKIISIDNDNIHSIKNLSMTQSFDELEHLVSSYAMPRDINRIKKGLENGENLPYPVILKGSKGMFIMSGNTRINVARLMEVPARALLVDVSE